MKTVLLAFISIFATAALASNLQTTQKLQSSAVEMMPKAANCDVAIEQLRNVRAQIQQNDNSVIGTLIDVTNVMNNWYAQLSTYEGRTINIPFNYFLPIRNSANTQANNTRIYQNNFNILQANLNTAIQSVLDCTR